MNHSPFWPLVWKEYRASRAFWLAMAAIGLAAQATAVMLARRPVDRDWWLYGLALMISTGFALGIGGTLFAVEHEDRTFGMLRVLPVRARELGFAKLLSAFVGVVSLVAALWLTASVMAGGKMLSAHDARQLWGLWGLACAEGLGWGILCSLAIRSPLRATLLAVVAVSLVNQFGVTLTQTHNLAEIASYVEAVPFRLALLALVVAADVWLLPRWLSGQYPQVRLQKAAAPTAMPAARSGTTPAASASSRAVWHLVWQSWREGRSNALLLLVGVPVYIFLFNIFSIAFFSTRLRISFLAEAATSFLPAGLLGALVGALVFHADQVHGPRFLAARGVSARSVWLSRQIAWGGWLVVCAVALVVLPLVLPRIETPEMKARFNDWWWESRPVRRWLVSGYANPQIEEAWQHWIIVFSAYAAGQFVSLSVRKGVVALVLATTLGAIAAAWAWTMSAAGIPAWWSVLPVALALLLATWLRVPAWLVERLGWRGWVAPLAAVAVPVALLAVEVPSFRANQINARQDVGSLSATYTAEEIAEAQTTYKMYEHAREFYGGAPDQPMDAETADYKPRLLDEVWMTPVVNLVLEASRRPYNLAALSLEQRLTLSQRGWFLGDVLIQEAARLQQADKLDRASEILFALLRRDVQLDPCRDILWSPGDHPERPSAQLLSALCTWAAAEGQTPEMIRSASERLQEWHAGWPSAEGRLLVAYQEIREGIEADGSVYTEEAAFARRFSAERERALHLLDAIVERQIDTTKWCATRMAEGDSVGWYSGDVILRGGPPLGQWLETTPLVQSRIAEFSLAWYVVSRETSYRATLIILALEAWKLEHGQLPGSLAELSVPGLEHLPLDPQCGYPFLYYPSGIAAVAPPVISPVPAAEIRYRGPKLDGVNLSERWAYADFMNGRPFLWSAMNQKDYQLLVDVDYFHGDTPVYLRFNRSNHPQDWHSNSALEILTGGTVYEVP